MGSPKGRAVRYVPVQSQTFSLIDILFKRTCWSSTLSNNRAEGFSAAEEAGELDTCTDCKLRSSSETTPEDLT
jgi:hypothetical protein